MPLVTRVICATHNFRATVGIDVSFALDYYEFPACVEIEDIEYLESRRPCCSAMNTTCCGHDDYDEYQAEPYDADSTLYYGLAFPSRVGYRFNGNGAMDSLTGLIIDSANYCEGQLPF